MSLCRLPEEGVAQIKDVYHHAWIWDLLCYRLTLHSEISLPQSPGIKVMPGPKLFRATMPQDLYGKIQVRNLCLPASRSGSQVNPPILDCSSFQM